MFMAAPDDNHAPSDPMSAAPDAEAGSQTGLPDDLALPSMDFTLPEFANPPADPPAPELENRLAPNEPYNSSLPEFPELSLPGAAAVVAAGMAATAAAAQPENASSAAAMPPS